MTAPARPELGPPRPWQFPPVHAATLDSGLTVLTCQVAGKPVATVEVVADLPVDSDPLDRAGLAVATARCLDEGTRRRDADAFAAALERHGASFHASAGYDGLAVAIDVPITRLADALPLLAEALQEPAFPDGEVERIVGQRLDQITQERANPAQRAAIELAAVMHLAGSRFALPQGGDAETVARIDRAAVEAAYRRVGPATTTVVVAGDLTPAAALELVADALGDWQGGSEPWEPLVPDRAAGPRVVVVDRPEAVQTQLLLAQPGPDRRHPQWAELTVGGYVLGGTLTSRIDALLREEKGYTYGMRASFQPTRRGGLFGISGSVDTESTEPALTDLYGVLRTAVSSGLTSDEVTAARDYLAGVSPLRWETPQAVAGHLATLVGNDLPLSWTDAYLRALREAQAEPVSAALSAHLDPEALIVVAVGAADTVVPAVAALGLPAPTVVPA